MSSSAPGPRERLADNLSRLRRQVGNPSYREMAKILAEPYGSNAVGETTLRNAATASVSPPKLATVFQFVTACECIAEQHHLDISERYFDPDAWRAWWQRIETSDTDVPDLIEEDDTSTRAGPGMTDPGWAGLVVALDATGNLPRVAELNPYRLGATESRYGDRERYDPTDRGTAADPYIPRGIDADLEAVLTQPQLTVVIGPSKAGKTRTLFEALLRTCPDARIVVPARERLAELPEHPGFLGGREPIVVWLDDLDRFLTGTTGLTPGRLAHLLARHAPTTVVATLRREEHDRFYDAKKGELAADIGELLRQATTIDLESTLADPAEQAAAETTYPDAYLGHYRALGYGLGEVLAGAPAVLDLYDRAARTDPPLRAVIETAIDWARIGRFDLIPEPTLTELAALTLRRNRPDHNPDPAAIAEAIHTARTRVEAAAHIAALSTWWLDDNTRGYRAFDYLIASDDGRDGRTARSIPETFWHAATVDTDRLSTVGLMAYLRGHADIALDLTGVAAEAGHLDAMFNLAFLLQNPGEHNDLAEAETWYRRAAEAGHLNAMFNLANLLQKRGEHGDLAEAETWYRRAVEADHISAMFNLAFLLEQRGERGDLAEAETWYRRAAEADQPDAMISLGELLEQRGEQGDLAEAETWYRRAVEAGQPDATKYLANLLQQRGEHGDLAEAEIWCRRAAEAGHADAMFGLANLLTQRGGHGDFAEAETWYRRAVEAGHIYAMNNLAHLLTERGGHGDFAEAETWYRRAAEAGISSAMYHLGFLMEQRGEQGDLVEAETWYRHGVEAGSADAMFGLAFLLKNRGDLAEAETWYRRSVEADAEAASAVNPSAKLLHNRGAAEEGVTWWRPRAMRDRVRAWLRFS